MMTTWRRWLWLLLLPPLAAGVMRLRFDTDVLNLLPSNLPVVEGLRSYQRHFAQAKELIITIEGGDPVEVEAAAQALAGILRSQSNLAARVMWKPPWSENPAQTTELLAFLWLNGDPGALGNLAERIAGTNLTVTLQNVRERLATSVLPEDLARAYDPFGLMQPPGDSGGGSPLTAEGLFASADGTFRVLYVKPTPALDDYRACHNWLTGIQRAVGQARDARQLPGSAQLRYTGGPAFVAEISKSMEHDMAGSSGGTLFVIAILFWLTHRRLRPLFWLLFLLVTAVASTLAVGGLLFGTINVVSMGFAAILSGLAEDFGILIYQEARSHPSAGARELRREVGPGIFWSALTTAGAFLTLNLSSLPGLAQLGSLVALGIAVAAMAMLYLYIPPLLRLRRAADVRETAKPERFLLFQPLGLMRPEISWGITAILAAGALLLVAGGGVRFDRSPDALKPQHCQAQAALDLMRDRLGRHQEPLWSVVRGRDEAEVSRRLGGLSQWLSTAVSNELVADAELPIRLWPNPANQQANRPVLASLLQERPRLRRASLDAGFTTNALLLSEGIMEQWERAVAANALFWPSNDASRWVFEKFASRTSDGFLAVGLVYPSSRPGAKEQLTAAWSAANHEGILLSGWELLGSSVFQIVVHELYWIVGLVFLLVMASLWLAFRNLKEVAFSLATLVFSALMLAAVMRLFSWDWNLMNMMAIPLILGMGVDFGIHIQLALRRYAGDRLEVRRSVGRALLLAGTTTVAGFASLAFSTNAGIASLGKVCALGITLALLTSVYLLPVWWTALHRKGKTDADRPAAQVSSGSV